MGCYHKYRHHRHRSLLYTFVVIVLLHHCLDATTVSCCCCFLQCFSNNFHSEINVCLDCGAQIHSHAVEQTYSHQSYVCVFLSTHRNTTDTPTRVHIAHTQVGVWFFTVDAMLAIQHTAQVSGIASNKRTVHTQKRRKTTQEFCVRI